MSTTRRAVAPCPSCKEIIWSDLAGRLCPRCGQALPGYIADELGRSGRFESPVYDQVPPPQDNASFSPRYCPSCGAPLASGAARCSACGAAVSYAAALASELRSGLKSGMRSMVRAPSLKVPPPIWAGVIEIFWSFGAAGWALGSVVLAYISSVAAGLGASRINSGVEGLAVWGGIAATFYVARLSVDITLAYGLLTRKAWAYGLYLWTVGPLVILNIAVAAFGAVLSSATGQSSNTASTPLSIYMVGGVILVAYVGLLVLQVWLVVKSKNHLISEAA